MKMKKCLAIILAAVMLLGCMSITAFAAESLTGFAGGTGTAESPYQIATLAQFENFASIVNGGNNCAGIYFVLKADIGTTDTPVTTMIGSFRGNFDGQNHTVTMNIHGTDFNTGLFGECYYATIANVNTAGSVSGTLATGGLCGFANGCTFNNCHNFATVTCGKGNSGGVCGALSGTMTNCSNSGDVTLECEEFSGYFGGVCGFNMGTVTNCYNSGTVFLNVDCAVEPTIGGVCGRSENVMVNCYNSGVVSHNQEPDMVIVGGVCGQCDNTINCYYDSSVGPEDEHATGLTTEQIKGAANDETSLAYKLNSYTDENTGSYPEGWFTWAIDETTGLPMLAVPEESSFLTTFTLNKDYNDKYTADTKSTKVNETVSFTITPVTANAPEFDPDTFTMTVTDGVGSAEVDLPDTDDITSVGDYWYEIEETAGTTAGVTYDDTTYYLHLIVSYKDGEFGFSSAAIRSSNDVTATDGVYPTTGKIDTVSNSYGEGTLTVAQTTTVNDEASDEDAFEVTVTFTAPTGTTVIGDITYGDLTIEPEEWENGSVSVEIELKGGESVTFENIPDGVTYTVEQTGKNEDKGYTLDEVAFDVTDETGDSVSDANVASGTIGDAADTVTISNSKTVPIDVGVILENGAFIVLALGALIAAAWLIVSKRRKSVDAE